MSKPMVQCGHAANATRNGEPVCVICFDLKPGWDKIITTPDLTGRKARCCYSGHEAPSSPDLPFFEHLPDKPFDDYYCGCRGWD